MNESQIEYGEIKLKNLSRRWGVSKLKAANILRDIKLIKEDWNWVNMDKFLNTYIHENTPVESYKEDAKHE